MGELMFWVELLVILLLCMRLLRAFRFEERARLQIGVLCDELGDRDARFADLIDSIDALERERNEDRATIGRLIRELSDPPNGWERRCWECCVETGHKRSSAYVEHVALRACVRCGKTDTKRIVRDDQADIDIPWDADRPRASGFDLARATALAQVGSGPAGAAVLPGLHPGGEPLREPAGGDAVCLDCGATLARSLERFVLTLDHPMIDKPCVCCSEPTSYRVLP